MVRCLLLALATLALGAELPRSAGYVNDFAGRLSLSERQELENRLRDYKRATSNEVVVAIVESLGGDSVDEYANRLFIYWGVGMKGRNNGVMLLWAPVERKVRIEVGRGLEGAIPNAAATEIAKSVTARFRVNDYVGGLNAGLDGILTRLNTDGPRYSDPTPAPAEEVPVESRPYEFLLLIPAAGVAGLIVYVALRWRRGRKRQLAAGLSRDLARAATLLSEGDSVRKAAASALDELRREAPEAVWDEFPSRVANAGGQISGLAQELESIRAEPHQELGELSRAHRAIQRWNADFAELRERLLEVGARLDSLRYCREHAALLLKELRDSLDRRGQVGEWGSDTKLVQAAGETYALAVAASVANPVNWLLVYDLLIDTQECLQCADNPSHLRLVQRTRTWMADDITSPAMQLMMMQSSFDSSSAVDSSSSTDSGSSFGDSGGGDSSGGDFGGGDSGGGDFGGGDSGGGGASSDY